MNINLKRTNARPNTEQAIKILNKLVERYAHLLETEEQMYLEDYASELRLGARDLDQTATLISRVLEGVINIEIECKEDELDETIEIEADSISLLLHWDESTPQTGDMHIPKEVAAEMLSFDRNETAIQNHALARVKADLRSLDRATTTLTKGQEAKFTRQDALMQIMRCAPD